MQSAIAAFHSSREVVFTRSRDPGNHEFTTCQWNAAYVARHGVYFSRMLSPIGRNALFCCLRYGVLLKNIASIKKVVVRGFLPYAQSPDVIHTARCLLELLLC